MCTEQGYPAHLTDSSELRHWFLLWRVTHNQRDYRTFDFLALPSPFSHRVVILVATVATLEILWKSLVFKQKACFLIKIKACQLRKLARLWNTFLAPQSSYDIDSFSGESLITKVITVHSIFWRYHHHFRTGWSSSSLLSGTTEILWNPLKTMKDGHEMLQILDFGVPNQWKSLNRLQLQVALALWCRRVWEIWDILGLSTARDLAI